MSVTGDGHSLPGDGLSVAAVQFQPVKGKTKENLDRLMDAIQSIVDERSDIHVIVFPETCLSGYFLQGGVGEVAMSSDALLVELAGRYAGLSTEQSLSVVLGFYEEYRSRFYNTAACFNLCPIAAESSLTHLHRKFFLPTYGVFEEKRYVNCGRQIRAFDIGGWRAAILICEDAWHAISAAIAAVHGAEVLFVLSASPARGFSGPLPDNVTRWQALLKSMAVEHGVWVVCSGLTGFEGGKGFSGNSLIVDPFGHIVNQGPLSGEATVHARLVREDVIIARSQAPLLADLEAALPDIIAELAHAAEGRIS